VNAKRTIVVGDLHGCFDELQDLLGKIHFQPQEDELIFSGDVINRGPKSKECINFLITTGALSVLGNHEYFLIQSHRFQEVKRRVYRLMRKEFQDDFEELLQIISSWPIWIEREDFLLVHAGLHPFLNKTSVPPEYLLSVREVREETGELKPWFDFYQGEKLLLFGHWAKLKSMVEKPNVIALDGGCVYGGTLRAVILPEKQVMSVPARKIYFSG